MTLNGVANMTMNDLEAKATDAFNSKASVTVNGHTLEVERYLDRNDKWRFRYVLDGDVTTRSNANCLLVG